VWAIETGAEMLTKRLLCTYGGVDASRLRNKALTGDDRKKIGAAMTALGQAKMTFFDAERTTPLQITGEARRMKVNGELGLVIIDHLHKLGQDRKAENRNLELGQMTTELKAMARELDVPVVLLCQLNRGVEGRENQRPGLRDIRESGHIEQDADQVWLLYRAKYYDKTAGDEVEVNVAKNRFGPTGTVTLIFDDKLTLFKNA
jgi:replicative DNA helicase